MGDGRSVLGRRPERQSTGCRGRSCDADVLPARLVPTAYRTGRRRPPRRSAGGRSRLTPAARPGGWPTAARRTPGRISRSASRGSPSASTGRRMRPSKPSAPCGGCGGRRRTTAGRPGGSSCRRLDCSVRARNCWWARVTTAWSSVRAVGRREPCHTEAKRYERTNLTSGRRRGDAGVHSTFVRSRGASVGRRSGSDRRYDGGSDRPRPGRGWESGRSVRPPHSRRCPAPARSYNAGPPPVPARARGPRCR